MSDGRTDDLKRVGANRNSRASDAFFAAATVACLAIIAAGVLRGAAAGAGAGAGTGSAAGGGGPSAETPTGPGAAAGGASGGTLSRKPREPFTRPNVRAIARDRALALNLSLREASFWRRVEGGEVQCELCPTLCRLRDGERGKCRVRVNYSGTLYALTYARVVAEHVDPVEKKPLNHFLPATGIYSIATAGCNMGCIFCQNYEISQSFPEDVRFEMREPAGVVAIAKRYKCPSIAYTYSEPSVFYEYMYDCAKLARGNGIANVWVTAGYINEKPLRELARYLDAANVDIKGFSEEFYRKYCDGHLAPVLRTVEILKEMKVHVEITNLIVPGGNDDPGMIRKLCRWVIEKIGPKTPVHFSRYHPDYKMERPGPTPLSTLRMAREIALREGLKYVYIGNIADPEGMNTYCAGCGRKLIERFHYYVKSNEVADGKCPHCGERIPGLWPSADGKSLVRIPVDEPMGKEPK
ncbi:MAG: AmmeMemoRadiSam system radical SAM enzyme [Planctomycetota bacterium]|nr:AmmeMemoRadiSam system radical SAM enzyme [Planctomycetota bacterium]